MLIALGGLLTVLLFLSIVPEDSISLVDNSLILQIILLTAFIMAIGLIAKPKRIPEEH
ncbi:MAG: hypothetical protein ACI8UX_002320 [Psychromonas sp.]|jgi:hypothetical protein